MSVLCLFCFILLGCGPSKDKYRTLGGQTMGTTWSLKWVGGPRSEKVLSEVEAELELVLKLASTYRDDSEISRFNQHRSVESKMVTPVLFGLVAQALQIAKKSDGAFDPTIGPLMSLYGFRGEVLSPPTEDQLAETLKRVGWKKLHLTQPTWLKKAHPDLLLDLGGIAKGFGIDRVGKRLNALGIDRFLLEIGGDVLADGERPDGGPWQVQLEGANGKPLEILIPLRGQGLATSGDYLQRHQVGSLSVHHIFDARIGKNAIAEITAATVVAKNATLADALATAVMVMGKDDGLKLVKSFQGDLLVQLRDSGGRQRLWWSADFPGMATEKSP